VRLLIEALCAEHIYIYRLVLQERKNRGSTILYRYISIYVYICRQINAGVLLLN
jgi:hypothetical protein